MVVLIWVLVIGFISILPVKWASDFVEGERTGWLFCAIAAYVAPAVAFLVFRLLDGGTGGFIAAYITSLVTFVTILRIPAHKIIGFAVIVLALQIAIGMAMFSFGFNFGRIVA